MKKIITFGVMMLITMMSMLYAFIQQTAANNARVQAEQNLILAMEARKEANINELAIKDAAQQREFLEEALKNCLERQ